ncbi:MULTISPECIES: CBS domain-containing protein [Sphingobacterium]|uniref:CBS domain-containing protein n=2 Tax=Sphingobacterium TaxID=28453 RepID=A0A4Q6XG50_9SPHI|nr:MULTISPECIES: CBS domain-containing protein [Sphingobacterium]MBD1434233.1 CBS domain-containing protein [Sphingobacterium micropteri]RZF58453.1 CBS domain-containing protein [Sphingobacterium corticibacterium]
MKTVKHILQTKGAVVYAVSQSTSVFDALQTMMEKNISALLIMEQETLVGIFTERDYARKIILQGKSSKETPVQLVMTPNPRTITTDEKVENCMELMTNNHVRHLPVVESGQVVGMISIGDLVKHIIEDQKQTIDQLQNYISS